MAKVLVICFAVAAVLSRVLMADEAQVSATRRKYVITLSAVKSNDGEWNTDYTPEKWNAVSERTDIVQQNASAVEMKQVPAKANITLLRTTYIISSEISIPCKVEGYPIPSVVWYKDEHQLEASERVDLQDPHQLIIRRANTSDSGTYRCEARNPYGNSTSSIEILVEGIDMHPNCQDDKWFDYCGIVVRKRYCKNKVHAKTCCRSCTLDGQLPLRGPHLDI